MQYLHICHHIFIHVCHKTDSWITSAHSRDNACTAHKNIHIPQEHNSSSSMVNIISKQTSTYFRRRKVCANECMYYCVSFLLSSILLFIHHGMNQARRPLLILPTTLCTSNRRWIIILALISTSTGPAFDFATTLGNTVEGKHALETLPFSMDAAGAVIAVDACCGGRIFVSFAPAASCRESISLQFWRWWFALDVSLILRWCSHVST